MSFFQEATQLNNEGINALFNDDHATAIESMSGAIKLIKEQLSTTSLPDITDNSVAARMKCISTIEIPPMKSSETIVFARAVRIPVDIEATSSFYMDIYTSAVIYNLALVNHHKASRDSGCLATAEKLYCLVLRLLGYDTLNVHTALVVKLACINNLSQIRCYNGDQENAREGLREVCQFMTNASSHEMLNEPQIQTLIMNLLLMRAPEVASAA